MRLGSRPNLSNANTYASPIHTYRLKFSDDGRGVPKDVEFEAPDAAMALLIAQREASNRSAELWCDGRRLCTIRRSNLGVWEIGSRALERWAG